MNHMDPSVLGGVSSQFSLLGDEIKRLLFLKDKKAVKLALIFQVIRYHNNKLIHPLTKEQDSIESRRIDRLEKMHNWLMNLYFYLINSVQKSDFLSSDTKYKFGAFTREIHDQWKDITGLNYNPKLHMLVHHVWDFIAEHGCLSEVSESTLESTHASINHIVWTMLRHLLREVKKTFLDIIR